MSESQIKSRCKKLLEKAGWQVVHLISTNVPGIPDTMILKDGRVEFIEFKQPGQEPRHLQLYRIEKLRANGFKVHVIKSEYELINCCL